jgi:membrane-bound lytic murein transglycosylase A
VFERVAPETLPPEEELSKSLSTKTQIPLSNFFFKHPKVFNDDLDLTSLRKAILNQLQAMEFVDPSKIGRLGDLMVTHGWLKETLTSFLNLTNENLPPKEFSQRLREEFVIHRVGKGQNKQVLFTGYYAPIIEASRTRTGKYRYPIYKLPEHSSQLQFVGRTNYQTYESSAPNAQAWRNYTRRQIDGEGILADRKLEIAWLKNDVDRFFLHVQGSGQLLFRDGTSRKTGQRHFYAKRFLVCDPQEFLHRQFAYEYTCAMPERSELRIHKSGSLCAQQTEAVKNVPEVYKLGSGIFPFLSDLPLLSVRSIP